MLFQVTKLMRNDVIDTSTRRFHNMRIQEEDACRLTAPPLLAHCEQPKLSVPSGMAENGVPTGVQLVGRTYDDETVFRAGAALEAVRPRFRDDRARPPL